MVWAAFITFVLILFRSRRYRNLRKVSWLLGTWEAKEANGDIVTEKWKRSKNLYVGERHFAKNGPGIESMQLNERDKKVTLALITEKGSASAPLLFETVHLSDSSFQCKNREQDSPYTISYTKLNDNEMIVETEREGRLVDKTLLIRKKEPHGARTK